MRFSAATTAERILPERLAHRAKPWLTRFDDIFFAADARGKAGRMSMTAFVIRIMSAAIAFASQVLLARWMGSFEYGIFVLVWVTAVIVGDLTCFGFQTSVIRFIPEYLAKGEHRSLRGILLTSRLFALLASSLVAFLGAAGLWLFSDSVESYYVAPFYLGIFCLPMIALSDVLTGISRANSWALAALAPIYLIRPVLILLFMGGALLAGFPADAKTALAAAIAATYLTTVGQLVLTTRWAEKSVPNVPSERHLRQWVIVSLPIFFVEGFFFLLTNADVLMVGAFLPPEDVAVYFAAVKTLALVHFVYFAVKAGVAQRYAALAHSGDPTGLATFARETANWTFWPSLLMAFVVLALGQFMLGLFGPGFSDGYPLLFVLLAGVVARAAVGPAESLLTMSGHQNICAVVYGAALALNVGLNVVLIPMLGLQGAAIATGVAMVFEACALAFTVWKIHGVVMIAFLPASLAERAR